MRAFKKSKLAKTFTVELRDHLGIVRRFVGLADHRQTEQLGRRIEALVGCKVSGLHPTPELLRWLEDIPSALKDRLAGLGIIAAERAGAAKRLADLVQAYGEHLQAKERSDQHVDDTVSMIQRAFTACGFGTITEIRPGSVERYLKSLRESGLSVRRSNGYLVACKSFTTWLWTTKLVSEDPLRSAKTLNANVDCRRQRRAATAEEMRRLITVAAQGPKRFGMTGPERALLYRFMAETGLRVNEVRSLTAGDFDLARLSVRVPAGYSKHRREDVVPLRPALAEALRGLLAAKLPTVRAFRWVLS